MNKGVPAGAWRGVRAIEADVKETTCAMRRFVIAILALIFTSATACAQDSLSARLSAGHMGDVAAGAYLAGDDVKFSLQNDG